MSRLTIPAEELITPAEELIMPAEELITPREIERWIPFELTDIVGNYELKKRLINQLRLKGTGPNILIDGDPGTGKTVTTLAYFATENCPLRDGDTPTRCGVCDDCRLFDILDDTNGAFARLRDRANAMEAVQFYHLNCGAISEARLREIVQEIRDFQDHSIVYLDEVHRLNRGQRDHLLLKPMRELNASWIASSAHVDQLDRMFKDRFAIHVSTELPEPQELAELLAERCHDWSIDVDAPETIVRLVEYCSCRTLRCIQGLAQAASCPERRLTRDFVDSLIRHSVDSDVL